MALSCSKKLSALLKGIMSKHKGDFYCLNFLHSFRTKAKLESHKRACQKICNIIIAFNKIIIEKTDGCKNNPEIHSQQK